MTSSRLVVVALAVVGVACSGASGPPRGPSYTPSGTPEAASSCPEQARRAKQAREDAIGAEERDARVHAAEAVFAHAECERGVFDALPLQASVPEQFKQSVDALKAQFYTAQNLYLEVVSYDLPEWVVAGYARAGDLYGAYADKLRNSDPGDGVQGTDRAAWISEVDEIARPVDRDAAEMYGKALDVVQLGPPQFASEPHVAPYIKAACAGLRAKAPERLADHQVCR